MMVLRPFKNQDAYTITGWIRDETALRKWSADRYERFPLRPEDIISQYAGHEYSDTLFPMTAVDESGIVGHLIMRFPDDDRSVIRFGFVIVDDQRRGVGYGKQMLSVAIDYAVKEFQIRKIILGVFENNPEAHYCYQAIGFRDVATAEFEYYHVMGEKWKCLEMVYDV